MRTTVTLDPDVEATIHHIMQTQGVTFKEAINESIRRSAPADHERRTYTQSFHMGTPTVSLDRALQLAGDLEDEEIAQALQAGR